MLVFDSKKFLKKEKNLKPFENIRVNYCLNRLYLSTVCSQLDNWLNANG